MLVAQLKIFKSWGRWEKNLIHVSFDEKGRKKSKLESRDFHVVMINKWPHAKFVNKWLADNEQGIMLSACYLFLHRTLFASVLVYLIQ